MISKHNPQLFLVSALTFFSSLVLITSCNPRNERQTNVERVIPVRLETVKSTTVVNNSEYIGTLDAQEKVSLAPRIDGRISEILVSQGDRVSKGDVVVRLEPTREQEDVNVAMQNLNSEKATLRQTQAELKMAESNRAVALAEVESARANLQDLEARVEFAGVNLERTKTLVREGALPEQNLDNSNRDLKTNIAQRNSRKESLKAAIQSFQAVERQIEQIEASIDSQQAIVKGTEAELNSVSQDLAFNTIKAPIDGIVGNFNQKVGDYIGVGEEFTSITNNQNLELNINVPVEYRDRLRTGLQVEIINDDGSVNIAGAITYVAPLVRSRTQSILTKATFPNQSSLKDREYVKARIIWSEKPGILVPTTAVSTLGGQNFIYIAQENNSLPTNNNLNNSRSSKTSLIARQQPIQLGKIQDQQYQVVAGVRPGDKIAVSNILSLTDGISIRPTAAEQEIGSLK